MATITLTPKNETQYNLLIVLAREMGINYSISETTIKEKEFLENLKQAGKEAKLIAAGKVKAKTLKQVLNEL